MGFLRSLFFPVFSPEPPSEPPPAPGLLGLARADARLGAFDDAAEVAFAEWKNEENTEAERELACRIALRIQDLGCKPER